MELKKRELAFTIEAYERITDLCGGDIKKLDDLFKDASNSAGLAARIYAVMANASEHRKQMLDPEYKPEIIPEEYYLAATLPELTEMMGQISEAVQRDNAATIETEPEKKTPKNAGQAAKKSA